MEAPGTERVWFAHALRGPACLLVVFTHLFDLFPLSQPLVASIGHFEPVTGLPTVPWAGGVRWIERAGISPGTVGVSLFFLVSGFVIPFSLARRNPRGFVVRRFFRLYPTLWVCLLVTLAVLSGQAYVHGVASPFGPRAVGSSALLLSEYTRQPWVEPVLWSLAVEEIFYAVAATAALGGLLLSRTALVAAAMGLTAVCVVARGATPAGPLFWLGFNATYVCFILVGIVVHCVHQRRWSTGQAVAVGAAIFGLYVVASHNGPAAGVARTYIRSSSFALAIFVGLFAVRDRVPYARFLDGLSNISYPLYLVHGVNGYVVLRALYLLTGNYYVAAVATVLASIALAAAVHRWVEIPTNDVGRRLSRRLDRRRSPAPVEPATEPDPVVA